MIPISVCIIMKNEEKNIEKCLSALVSHGFVGKSGEHSGSANSADTHDITNSLGEIVVVDTGSTDRSVEIAGKYTDRIFHFDWCNDFAKAKNYAVSKAKNDYVLILDADEYLTSFNPDSFENFVKKYSHQIGQIRRSNYVEEEGIRTIQIDVTERFYNRNYFSFQYPIHEQLLPLHPQKTEYILLDFQIDHSGYLLSPEEQKKKAMRNNELLFEELKKHPEDPYLYFQIGQSYLLMRDNQSALPWFEKGLAYDVDPGLEYVQMMVTGYGGCLLNCGREEEALSLTGVYQEFSSVPEYVFLIGQIYMANHKYIEALGEFIKCLHMKPNRVPGMTSYFAYHNIGVINEMLGEKESAIAFYKKAGDYKRSKDRLKELLEES